MNNISKIEVYWNEWTEKYVVCVSSDNVNIASFVDTVSTFKEVEEFIEQVKESYPDIEIKIYE